MSNRRPGRSSSVDHPTTPTLEGEVSFGDRSPLFGILSPSQKYGLHLSLAAAARDADSKNPLIDLASSPEPDFVPRNLEAELYTMPETRNTQPTVREALKDIEIFEGGDQGKVRDFIRSCTYAREIILHSEAEKLLKAVLSTRIKGSAARALEYKSIATWNALEEELESMCVETRTLASLQVEFNSCRQRPNEDVKSYGLRVEQLTAQVVELTMKEAAEEDSRPTLERQIRKQSVNIFVRGLNDRLKVLVKSRQCEKLREAISIAIEEERDLGPIRGPDRVQRPRNREGTTGTCYNCGKPGHIARDCRSRITGSRDTQRLPTPNRYVRKFEVVICHYCKKQGHFIRDCRTRIANEEKRLGEGNRGSARQSEDQTGPSRDGNRRDNEPSGNGERTQRTGNRIASYQ